MRVGTIETAMAELLLQVGQCYKADLLLYGRLLNHGDAVMPTKVLKKMIEEKTVAIREIQKKGKSKVKEAVALTKRGKTLVLNTLDDAYHNEHYREYGADFRTSSPAALRTRFLDARIKVMFAAAGVPVFRSEKPSLSRLIKTMDSGTVTFSETEKAYREITDKEECMELLRNGVYYTIKEVRQFLDEQSPGASDTTYRSRVRGIFLSADKCVMVYISPIGENKIMRLSPEGERNLLKKLREILSITNTERAMLELTRKDMNKDGSFHLYEDVRKGSVNALMISDTDAMVYAMATGNKNGRIRNTDTEKIQQVRVSAARKNRKNPRYVWLTGNRELYRRVFVTPFTYNGVVSLSYLCHTTAEEWARTSAELVQKSGVFKRNTFNPMYPGTLNTDGTEMPVLFFPIYEVTELAEIAKRTEEVCVITYEDMANVIAHSVKKELRYFDVETMEEIDPDTVMIYDANGYEKGPRMIEAALSEIGKKCSNAEIKRVAGELGMTYIKFCNSVARGGIPVSDVLERMELDELPDIVNEKKQSARTDTTSISIVVSNAFASKVKQAAKLHGVNVSAYIKNLIATTVNEDSRRYDEHIAREKETWNT